MDELGSSDSENVDMSKNTTFPVSLLTHSIANNKFNHARKKQFNIQSNGYWPIKFTFKSVACAIYKVILQYFVSDAILSLKTTDIRKEKRAGTST